MCKLRHPHGLLISVITQSNCRTTQKLVLLGLLSHSQSIYLGLLSISQTTYLGLLFHSQAMYLGLPSHSQAFLPQTMRQIKLGDCANTFSHIHTDTHTHTHSHTSSSSLCTFHLLTVTRPVVFPPSLNLTFAPYNTHYPSLEKHMDQCGLRPSANCWNNPLSLGTGWSSCSLPSLG